MEAMIVIFINSGFLALPMAIFIILLGTVPIMCGILSHVFLNESIDKWTVYAMIVSFGAIVLLAFAN